MSQQNAGFKAFIAQEALEIYRRVKLGDTGAKVVYADQSDGDNYIGITQHSADIDKYVTVALKTRGRTFKVEASEALSAKAALYAADNGKVSDTSSGNIIGVALEAATADGEIIEAILDDVAGIEIDGAATAVESEDSNGSVPVIFAKTGITDASTAVAIVTSLPFKCKVIKWWLISRNTTAANIKLQNGDDEDISANKAKGTADDAIVFGGTIVAEKDELAVESKLQVLASQAAAFDVFVEVIRIV